ncbi:MAG: CinA family nicotinamide mononucleotide deamidase-related protein [Flavobacteriales bacterium]
MQAHIITIGDELLIGQVADTNSVFIAKQLNTIGIQINQISSIQDQKEAIVKTLDWAKRQADIIILTGGLGPTKDDITKKTLAEYFDDYLVFHQESFDNMKRIFDARNYTISEVNKAQADIPSKAIPIINRFGTASAMYFKEEGKHIFSLPGVPFEMKYLIQEKIIPLLKETFNLPFIINQTIVTQGIGESFLAEIIEEWELNLPPYIKLAYLPSASRVRLRLSGQHMDYKLLKKDFHYQINGLKKLIPDYILSTNEEEVEEVLGEKLKEKNLTIATAESCSGGKIAHKITSVSGSSAYYKGSIVSYATEVKENILQIPSEVIKKHTVVSKEVALLMAQSVKKILSTDIGIATTGVAGPNKGEDEKEVGIVYIAIATPKEHFVKKYNFGTFERTQFIEKVSNLALQKVYEIIQTH